MKFGIREFVLMLILLAMPLSSYWLVFRPQNTEISQAKREIQHKREMLNKLREATSQSEDLARANIEIAQSIEGIEARLPTTKEVDSVVRQVSELAVESGLEAPLMSTEKPFKAAMYMEQPLKMSIKGDFHGFYDFLLRIEKLPRITRIPDMKIRRTDDIDGHMRAEFTLSIYFQQEGAQ